MLEKSRASTSKRRNNLNKLETLANAYNDIQDRLYEIDKSWKICKKFDNFSASFIKE